MPISPSTTAGSLRAMSAALALAAIASGGAVAAEYMVAPNGNDRANGSADAPWKTIARASKALQPGDTCWLRAGTYRETVTPANGGQPGKPISYRAWRDEVAVVSGADPIEGWTKSSHPSGKVWSAAMPWTLNDGAGKPSGCDQLFVGGRMVPEARFPNLPPGAEPARCWRDTWVRSTQGALLKPGTAKGTGTAVSQYTVPGLAKLPKDALTGASILFMPGFLWAPMSARIESQAGEQITFSHPWFEAHEAYQCRATDFLIVYGGPGLIDSEGEWCRQASGAVLLWSPEGKAPAPGQVEAKRREWAFDLRGKPYVTISGVGIFAAGILSDERAPGVVVEGVEGRYLNHRLSIPGWWAGLGEGVRLGGAESVLRDCELRFSAGSLASVIGAKSRVVDNILTDAGYVCGGNLHATGGEGLLVERNTIRDCGGQNALDIRNSAGSIYRFNDVSGSARLLIDGGAVMITRNFDAKGTEVCHNYIHDTTGLGDGKKGYYGNAGIYAEGGTKGYRLHHNVIRNVTGASICLPDDASGSYQDYLIAHNTGNNRAVFRGMAPSVALFANLMAMEGGKGTANVDWADGAVVDAAGGDFRPRAAALVGKAPPIPALKEAIADIGALLANAPVPRYGATLTSRQARVISIGWAGTPSAGTTFTIGDLPSDRVPGANFRLQIGANEPGGTLLRDGNGTWLVRNVPCKGPAGPVQVVIGDVATPARRPAAQAESAAKAKPAASEAKPARAVKPEALARYQALLIASCQRRIAAGAAPAFLLKSLRQQVMVEEASGASLTVRQPGVDGGVFSVALKMLDRGEFAGLATALATSNEPRDHLLAGFFLLADGQEEAGQRHLSQAGPDGAGVAAEFAEPAAATGSDAPTK